MATTVFKFTRQLVRGQGARYSKVPGKGFFDSVESLIACDSNVNKELFSYCLLCINVVD